jgi:hypothetical protein
MAYLVAAADCRDLGAIQKGSPETWRRVRRFNLPVQLALAAAEEVIIASRDPKTATIISLAPCQAGSADLYRWGDVIISGMASGNLGDLRMNPTQTLHAVDNLALSAFAITHGNRGDCLGLGGSAGQAWCGLEAVLERFADTDCEEVLLMGGDQDSYEASALGLGEALLFSRQALPLSPEGKVVRLVRVGRADQQFTPSAHATAGLANLVSTIRSQPAGLLSYDVPPEHTDGLSAVTVVLEISI